MSVDSQEVQRKLTTIFSTDVEGYSRLMADDEVATIRTLTSYREAISAHIERHGGRVVDSPGDNLLAEFGSVVHAVQCGMEIQRELGEKNEALPEDRKMYFRIGINLGDVVVEGERLYGDGVNIAARLESLADGGGICISGGVYEQVQNKLSFGYEDLGEKEVKNIAQPIRVYRVLGAGREGAEPANPEAPSTPPHGNLVITDKPSIAVLPFTNMSTDPEQEFFSDGITEDIITALSKLKGFFVISRNTTVAYKGKSIDPRKVAGELGVRYLLQGSVRTAGTRARITAQLTDPSNGTELWAERYDRNLDDVFAIQDEITEHVVGCLGPELYSAEYDRLKRKPPQNLDAWENFIRGLFLYSQHSNEGTKEALVLLQRAIELDSNYAQAHGLFALVLAWRAIQGWEVMNAAMEQARRAANLAKACDPKEPWAYMAHGMIGIATRGDADAIEAFRRVIDFSPNFAYAHGLLGASYALSGRGEDAIEHIDRAMRLSPRDIFADEPLLYYAFAHFQAENYNNAASYAEKAIQLRPGHPVLHIMASASRALAGNVEKAKAALMDLKALVPEITASEIEQQFIYVLPEDRSRLADGLRRAGLG